MKHSLDHVVKLLCENSDRLFAVAVAWLTATALYVTIGILSGSITTTAEAALNSREVIPWVATVSFLALICSVGLFFRQKWAFMCFGVLLVAMASVALYQQEWFVLFFCGTFGLSWIAKGLPVRPKITDNWDVETFRSLEDYNRRHPSRR